MDDPVGDVVVFDKIEDLRLVDIAGVCPAVDDPVGVAGVRGAEVCRLLILAPHRISARCSKGREQCFPLCRIGTGNGFGIVCMESFILRTLVHVHVNFVPGAINGDESAGFAGSL